MTLAMAVSEMEVRLNWNGLKREWEAEEQAFLWRSFLKGDVRYREGFFKGKRNSSMFYADRHNAVQSGKLVRQERAGRTAEWCPWKSSGGGIEFTLDQELG